MSKDYAEENLARLYEMELARDRLERYAEERLVAGEGISVREFIRENGEVFSKLSEEDLARLLLEREQEEKQKGDLGEEKGTHSGQSKRNPE